MRFQLDTRPLFLSELAPLQLGLLCSPTHGDTMPVVRSRPNGVDLVSLSVTEHLHRELVEEDAAGRRGPDALLAEAAGEAGRQLYTPGVGLRGPV